MEVWKARDRKSTRLNSSHSQISYAVFCLKKKKKDMVNKLLDRIDLAFNTSAHVYRYVTVYLLLAYLFFFFFFNDTATTEIYTLSLHDALPISWEKLGGQILEVHTPATESSTIERNAELKLQPDGSLEGTRSEEHTSELQSQSNLVCRLLLEKKKKRHGEQTPRSNRPCIQHVCSCLSLCYCLSTPRISFFFFFF